MRLALLTLPLLIGACATAPTEPSVLALPGTGKGLQQFNTDDIECRQSARPRPEATGSWTEQQRRYDFAYIQCMYAKGHRVPVPGQYIGAPSGGPPPPPPGKPEPAPQ
ncbi:MAG TPA: glycine zipper family protein [Burkholderiales bacterium]|nr:glycine zipper family protein [Burkholderiales bacterium]